MNVELLQALDPYLNRKTRCRLRAVSTLTRDYITRPRPFKKLDTSDFAKIKMILNLGRKDDDTSWPLGWYTIRERRDGLREVVVRYGYTDFTLDYMMREFRFMKCITSRLFFMAYKFREFDYRLINFEDSFQWQIQLGPELAIKILEAPHLESASFLLSV
jgi:hypothetical protein